MLQIVLTLSIFIVVVIPMGNYLYKIADNQKTLFDPMFDKVDGAIYRLCGIDRNDMGWKQYATSLLLTNAVMLLTGFLFLRLQAMPFLNPNGIGSMESTLSFNTAISFMTNTNLQHYSGESGLSYMSQMLVITMMMFTSAATGYAACAAFARAISGQKSMGNFYNDFVRVTTRVLLPISLAVALFLVQQGVPQSFSPNITLGTIEGKNQDIAMGPIASLVSIKHLGTNGGGFLGANSSTPLENPNIVTNITELLSMMVLPGACVIMFGLMFHHRKRKGRAIFGGEGRSVFTAMAIIFLLGLTVCYMAERAGNPHLARLGLSQAMGSMEGKEMRFGIAQSALFTTATTSFTTGTVNNMHDTLTPLGGMVPLLNMTLNVVFGGIGVGFMNMAMYVLLTVFLCGLMVGRTPEYLGKKIESTEIKLAVICILVHPLLILGFSALAVTTEMGVSGISNPGFHGLSQVLYEFSSASANNGSGFEGLGDNTIFWNLTTGVTMFIGRYASIILQLAIAASLMTKREMNESPGTLKTDNLAFAVTLSVIVVVFAALTFFPVLALGPIAEHLSIWG